MANGNQMLAAVVCILFFTGFVVYSTNEDRRPPHLVEGTDEAAIEKSYKAQLRTLTAALNQALATRAQIAMELKAHKLPGEGLIDQAGKLQASVALSAAAFHEILANMGPVMGPQVTQSRRSESSRLLEEMRKVTSEVVSAVKRAKPTLSQVVHKQQFNAVHNTVHLSQNVRNRNRSPYNEAAANTMNHGGFAQPVLQIAGDKLDSDYVQGGVEDDVVVNAAKDRESAGAPVVNAVSLNSSMDAAPPIATNLAVSQAERTNETIAKDVPLKGRPKSKRAKVERIVNPGPGGGFDAANDDGDVLLDLVSDDDSPVPVHEPEAVERPSGEAEEAFENYKKMVNAKLAKGDKVPPPPSSRTNWTEWFNQRMSDSSKAAGSKRKTRER